VAWAASTTPDIGRRASSASSALPTWSRMATTTSSIARSALLPRNSSTSSARVSCARWTWPSVAAGAWLRTVVRSISTRPGSCATAGATSRRKVAGLTDAGTEVSATVGIDVGHTPHNHHYLQTKRTAMNHHLPSLDALVGGTTTPRPAAGGTNAAEGLA